MRSFLQSIWLGLLYLSASLACGDVLKHMTIIKSSVDASFAHGHIEWALGIFISVLYVWAKPLFYSWRELSKTKLMSFLVAVIAWPLYLLLIASMLLVLPINWPQFIHIWRQPYFWLWIFVASDPLNILGKWIDESKFWQSHIDSWRSYGTLNWLYREYPPKSASDVAVGLVSMTVVTLIAPLVYWLRS